jgi:hypothetical protein
MYLHLPRRQWPHLSLAESVLLYQLDYAVGRYISLERIFEDAKEGYTRHWKQAHRAGIKGNTTSNSGSTTSGELCCGPTASLKSVGTIERFRGCKGHRVHTEILDRALPFSISEIEETCPGVSRDVVRLGLPAMKSEELIESTGKGRGAKWRRTT